MDAELTARWIRLAATRIAERRVWLTDLDAAIGDGDHGINLDRGFRAAVAGLEAGDPSATTPGVLLVAVGRTITGTVGGASGALYGRAFTQFGARLDHPALEGRPVSPADVADALDHAVEAIARLGRARTGEKTMLDALVPASRALRAALEAGRPLANAAVMAADAADAGARATIPLMATKGRASYLGDRSIGHLDPGAASSALLVRALADALSAPPATAEARRPAVDRVPRQRAQDRGRT